MTLQEFYNEINGDYSGTLSRLMKEERMMKYLTRFVDAEDYSNMINAIKDNDIEVAFRSSHNLKGVCLNLGLSKLADSSSRLCEEYRHGAPDHDVSALVDEVTEDYHFTIEKIKQL